MLREVGLARNEPAPPLAAFTLRPGVLGSPSILFVEYLIERLEG
jgi:hypothetical protein